MSLLDDGDTETVEDALDVLAGLPEWELAPSRWERVAVLLDQIAAARADRDGEGLREAVVTLEMHRPVRATRIGAAGAQGIPDPVRDLHAVLVHTLTRPAEAPAGTADRPASPPTLPSEGDRGRPTR